MGSNAILQFLQGVDHLHAFYTENVRMLAHAYDLSDEEAANALEAYGFHNVARSILRPARVNIGLDDIRERGE